MPRPEVAGVGAAPTAAADASGTADCVRTSPAPPPARCRGSGQRSAPVAAAGEGTASGSMELLGLLRALELVQGQAGLAGSAVPEAAPPPEEPDPGSDSLRACMAAAVRSMLALCGEVASGLSMHEAVLPLVQLVRQALLLWLEAGVSVLVLLEGPEHARRGALATTTEPASLPVSGQQRPVHAVGPTPSQLPALAPQVSPQPPRLPDRDGPPGTGTVTIVQVLVLQGPRWPLAYTDMPKSASCSCPECTSTFSGFRSRCTTPCSSMHVGSLLHAPQGQCSLFT
jgi:hypothetical protein